MAKNEIVRLCNGVYQIRYYWLGMAGVYAHLVVGEEKALLIDACYSTTDARSYAESVTSLPIEVVNTHGHFDHIGGNGDFGEVYLPEGDRELAREHSDYGTLSGMMTRLREENALLRFLTSFKRFSEPMEQSLHVKPVEYRELPQCGFFELGGRRVHYIETPGHTTGSTCLFDDESRLLFTGDMVCEGGVLLSFEHSTSVEVYLNSLRTIRKYYDDNGGTAIVPSHQGSPVRPDLLDGYIALSGDVVSGKLAGRPVRGGEAGMFRARRSGLQILYRTVR